MKKLLLLSLILLCAPVHAKKPKDWRDTQKDVQLVLTACGAGCLGAAAIFGCGWRCGINVHSEMAQDHSKKISNFNDNIDINSADSRFVGLCGATQNAFLEGIKKQIQSRKIATIYAAAAGLGFFAIAYLNQRNINAYEARKEERKQNLNVAEKQ